MRIDGLTTDDQAFGHKPNGRGLFNYFFVENIGLLHDAYRSLCQKSGRSYYSPKEEKKAQSATN